MSDFKLRQKVITDVGPANPVECEIVGMSIWGDDAIYLLRYYIGGVEATAVTRTAGQMKPLQEKKDGA